MSIFSVDHGNTKLSDSNIFALEMEEENSSKYAATKLSGGFSIKDILKPGYCFTELSRTKEKYKIDFQTKYCHLPNLTIPNQMQHINSHSSDDGEKVILNRKSPILIPTNDTTAYCEYVLQLQEKLHQQLLLNNSQVSNDKGKDGDLRIHILYIYIYKKVYVQRRPNNAS